MSFFLKNRWPDALPQTREESQEERYQRLWELGMDAVPGPPPTDPPASRARSRAAPRGRNPSQMWSDALDEAHRSLEEEGMHPRGRVRQRAQEILKQWREGSKDRKVKQRTD